MTSVSTEAQPPPRRPPFTSSTTRSSWPRTRIHEPRPIHRLARRPYLPIAAKVPTAGHLGKQFRVRGDVLLDGLSGLTGDLFDVMGLAVVAVLAMQTRHSRDVLLIEVGQARGPQVLAHPVVVGDVFRGDRPSQRARVLLGQIFDVEHLRTSQP